MIESPEPIGLTPIVIRFDGGNGCNDPKKGYGNGYGSFRINSGEVQRISFGIPMSNNAAETKTLIEAIKSLPVDTNYTNTRLCIYGDSQIVLNWAIRAHKQEVIKEKRCRKWSQEFRDAVLELYAILRKFGQVATKWEPRERNVAVFGH